MATVLSGDTLTLTAPRSRAQGSRFKHSSNPQLAKYILVGLELPPSRRSPRQGWFKFSVFRVTTNLVPSVPVLASEDLSRTTLGSLSGRSPPHTHKAYSLSRIWSRIHTKPILQGQVSEWSESTAHTKYIFQLEVLGSSQYRNGRRRKAVSLQVLRWHPGRPRGLSAATSPLAEGITNQLE
jgi:hypothetical protein